MTEQDRERLEAILDAQREMIAAVHELVSELRAARIKPRRRYAPRPSGKPIDPAVQAEADRRLARAGIRVVR